MFHSGRSMPSDTRNHTRGLTCADTFYRRFFILEQGGVDLEVAFLRWISYLNILYNIVESKFFNKRRDRSWQR